MSVMVNYKFQMAVLITPKEAKQLVEHSTETKRLQLNYGGRSVLLLHTPTNLWAYEALAEMRQEIYFPSDRLRQ